MQKLIFTNSRGQVVEIGNSAPFILKILDGTAGIDTTLQTSKSPGQDGSTLHDVLLEERAITIEGTIFAKTQEELYLLRQQLASVFNPKLKEGTLFYQNNAGIKAIKGVAEQSPVFKEKFDNSRKQVFTITLLCPNPYWKDLTEERSDVAIWVGDFSFPLELSSSGTEIGHRETSTLVNIRNNGDVECGIRIEFTALASVVNPSLYNVNTQEYLRIKRTLQAGDKLVISTEFANKSVELIRGNVITNVFHYVDLSSTFLQLDIGDNLLKYDADNGIDNLEVSIYHISQYVGC